VSSINSSIRPRRYGYAICGLGPAGCGFLLHAIKEDAIGKLVDQGLVLIDRANAPGPGKVGRYQLTGNSLSRAFLDCVDDPKLAWLFDDLRASAPSVVKLRHVEYAAPPLHVVGDFLANITRRTLSYLIDEYDVPVLLGTSVDRIRRERDGHFTLDLRDPMDGDQCQLEVDNVLCSFGGRQAVEVVGDCELKPGLSLGDHADYLIPSDDFLMMSNETIRDVIPIRAKRETETDVVRDVVVVGGSHSAMSTIDRLTEALEPIGLRRIIMLHRDPLRLYYATVGDAHRDGYAFDEANDICPMSGRVNRFGGLRYRSFDVARSIIETGRMPDQSVEIVSVPLRESAPETVQRYLKQSAAVIACLGYQANLPELVDHQGRTIDLQNRARGLEIDADGCALTIEGQPISGLYVYGIGSRFLKRSDAIGGEPSFEGSADGIWLYHNHGGGVILNALRKTWSKELGELIKKERRRDHVRVVSQG